MYKNKGEKLTVLVKTLKVTMEEKMMVDGDDNSSCIIMKGKHSCCDQVIQ